VEDDGGPQPLSQPFDLAQGERGDENVTTDLGLLYKEVLTRTKFKLTQEVIAEWVEVLDTVPILVDVELEVDFPRDRKDAKFIACAQTVNADFLITGDRDFTEAQNLGRTRIISVSLFKQFFVDMMTN
jgi:predicted nucleic acid-binding protein